MNIKTWLALAALTFSPATAFAAGDAPAEEAAAPAAKSTKDMGCARGEVGKMDGDKASCLKLTAGVMPDDALYEQGKLLATQGEYDWALEVLAVITKQDDAKVLNYIGYSHRKAGRLETGIEVYKKALALDPNYVQAREYLGEAYVLAGKRDLAEAELAEIKTRCGDQCPEFVALNKALNPPS
jgi:Flp pilus assembly protein TadD